MNKIQERTANIAQDTSQRMILFGFKGWILNRAMENTNPCVLTVSML